MKNYKQNFPIFNNKINGKDLIYLDSAATSQKPQVVLDALDEYYKTYNANVKRGIYPIAEKATAKVEEVRQKVAKFINALHSEEIIFVRNTTEAINLVAYTWGKKNIKKGDVITISVMEHHSNFVPWQQLAFETGAVLNVLDIDESGNLDIKSQNSELLKRTKILAVTHVSNVLGTINSIKEIKKQFLISRGAGSSFAGHNSKFIILLDAAQSVPHMKVDVQDLGCDFLAFSGHKTMASTGIGVLYGEKDLLSEMPPFLFGGEMIRTVSVEETTWADLPHKFEAGTPDIAGIVSLGAAIDYLEGIGMDVIREHEKELISYALEQMKTIDGLTIYGSKDIEQRGGVIAFNLERIHAHDIAQILGDKGICVRAGHHCTMPLHKRLGIAASARVSFSLYNDKNDIDLFINELKEVKKIFK